MKKSLKYLLIIIIAISVEKNCCAQACPPDIEPLPQMFVAKASGESYINEFFNGAFLKRSKYKHLIKIDKIKSSPFAFTYKWEAINSLVTQVSDYAKMRVLLAIGEPDDITGFPKFTHSKLILLFSPELESAIAPKFFFLNEGDNKNYEVPYFYAQKWINEYNSFAQAGLRKTIDKNDTANTDETVPEKFSDTKSVVYERDDFEEAFIKEQKYQVKHHPENTISAIKVSLAAFPKTGKTTPTFTGQFYKKRLFILYDYMKKNTAGIDEVFHLDGESDFNCRPQNSHNKGLDNGQLCPTKCN